MYVFALGLRWAEHLALSGCSLASKDLKQWFFFICLSKSMMKQATILLQQALAL